MTAPVVPKVKNILDTSNFEKQIQYAEKEKMDPFFGLAKGEDEVNQGGIRGINDKKTNEKHYFVETTR